MPAYLVAEIQGLYGPVTVTEALLQRIWQRGDFAQDHLTTLDGLPLCIHRRGSWNRYEGPDFNQAEIEVAEQHLIGDVEIHFYARDWFYHGHDRDPNFARVILHVVLFEPSAKERATLEAQSDTQRHILVLLPLLEQDIEAYATEEEAFLAIERHIGDEDVDPWLAMELHQRRRLLKDKALLRWQQKRQFAEQRLAQSGWNEA